MCDRLQTMVGVCLSSLLLSGAAMAASSAPPGPADVARWMITPATFVPVSGGEPGVAAGSARGFFWVDRDTGTFWGLEPSAVAPRRLGRSGGFPSSLVAAADRLHWVERNHRSVGALKLDAGAGEERLSFDRSEEPFPTALVRHGDDVLLASLGAEDGQGSITRLRVHRGEEAIAAARRPAAIAVATGHAYWTDAATRSISRIPLAGGKVQVVVKENVIPSLLVASDRYLCWAEPGNIILRDLATGKQVSFRSMHDPTHLALTASGVWWVGQTRAPVRSEVMFGSVAGGEPVRLLAGSWQVGGLAATGDRALVTLPTERAVVLFSRPGAEPVALAFSPGLLPANRVQTLALGQDGAEILGSDSRWLYWRASENAVSYLLRVPLSGGTPWRLRLDVGISDPVLHQDGMAWVDEKAERLWWSGASDAAARAVYRGRGIGPVGKAGAALIASVTAANEPEHRSSIVRVPLDGGAVTDLLSVPDLRDVLADGNDVVWSDGRGGIHHMPAVGGAHTLVVAPAPPSRALLALRAGQVYFSEAGRNGAQVTRRVPVHRAGERPAVVARVPDLRTGRVQGAKNERDGGQLVRFGDDQAAWVTEDGQLRRAPRALAAGRDAPRREIIRALPPGLRAWLASTARVTEDSEPGRFYWPSNVCDRLSKEKLPGEERCMIWVAGGGRALNVTAVYDCSSDSCSTRSWIVTEKGKVLAARDELQQVDYLPGRDEIVGERTVIAEGGFDRWVLWLYTHPATGQRPLLHAMAPCFSPRVSPGGRWVICRDKSGNVLRVGPEGGPPEVVHRNLYPESVAYTPYNTVKPGPVELLSPSRILISDPELGDEILPWSEESSWDEGTVGSGR